MYFFNGILGEALKRLDTKIKPSTATKRNWKKVTIFPAPGSSLEMVNKHRQIEFAKLARSIHCSLNSNQSLLKQVIWLHNLTTSNMCLLDNQLQKDNIRTTTNKDKADAYRYRPPHSAQEACIMHYCRL